MNRAGGVTFFLFSCAILSCSGGTTSTTPGGTSGGASGSVPSGAGLTGTWDLVASGGGKAQSTGTLAISATSFDLTLGSTRLTYTITGGSANMVWQEHSNTDNLTVARTSETFNTGALPLPLGGTWTVTEPSANKGQCAGTVGTNSLVHCEDADLPSVFPNPKDGQAYEGKRTQAGTSIFGDLGGEWSFEAAGGTEGCHATFSGSNVFLQCTRLSRLDGSVNLTFSSDVASVSGTTNSGSELSGHKR